MITSWNKLFGLRLTCCSVRIWSMMQKPFPIFIGFDLKLSIWGMNDSWWLSRTTCKQSSKIQDRAMIGVIFHSHDVTHDRFQTDWANYEGVQRKMFFSLTCFWHVLYLFSTRTVGKNRPYMVQENKFKVSFWTFRPNNA